MSGKKADKYQRMFRGCQITLRIPEGFEDVKVKLDEDLNKLFQKYNNAPIASFHLFNVEVLKAEMDALVKEAKNTISARKDEQGTSNLNRRKPQTEDGENARTNENNSYFEGDRFT